MVENVEKVKEDYFNWLYNFACKYRANKYTSYKKLMIMMYQTRFEYFMEKDYSRVLDGIDLRKRFIYNNDLPYDMIELLDGPCSVLEMMLALAIRMEEIMDDPEYGDRTQQWFWIMMSNLGISMVTDDIFDQDEVHKILTNFMRREYGYDGRGGLFYIRHSELDLSQEDIWSQMCAYLYNLNH